MPAWLVDLFSRYGYAVVFFGVRRLFTPLAAGADRDTVRTSSLVTALCVLAVGAWFTDYIGVHSVFGAFILGVGVPRGALTRELRRTIEPLTTALSDAEPETAGGCVCG